MLKKFFIGILLVAAFALVGFLAPRPVFAQIGGIEGDVKGMKGEPLIGITVQLDRKEIKGHFETKTDKKGHYFHTGLPSGTYRISLWDGTQQIDFHDNIRIPSGEPTLHDFDLKADQEAAMKNIPKEVKEQMEKREQEVKKQGDLKQHFEAGVAFQQSNQYDKALEEFQQAAQIDPTQYVVFGRMADTYSSMGKLDLAATNFQKTISILESKPDLKPDMKQNLAGYYNNYGGVLAKEGKTKDAMDTYQKAANINPESAGMYFYNMGAVLTNAHAPVDDRVAAFKKATEADPKNANAWYQYGLTLSEKMSFTSDGKVTAPPEMVVALNKYLELDPQGKYAEGAKGLIQAAGQTVTTSVGMRKETKKGKKQ
ncbi:MAG: tetratricopeptide repeat protein [Acidobacteriia bacterium]|nr:tetratricopeptide repeat protein [Terriglobia bacterium]